MEPPAKEEEKDSIASRQGEAKEGNADPLDEHFPPSSRLKQHKDDNDGNAEVNQMQNVALAAPIDINVGQTFGPSPSYKNDYKVTADKSDQKLRNEFLDNAY